MSNSSANDFVSYTSGSFEFHIPNSAGSRGKVAAVAWSYFLERKIPMTRGLDQIIRFSRIELIGRLPTSQPIRELDEIFTIYVFPEYSEWVENALFYLFQHFPFKLVILKVSIRANIS